MRRTKADRGGARRQAVFGQIVCKTLRPTLSDRCLSVLSCPVCDVDILWPNCWMYQDATWYGGRPRPKPHCVRWRSSYPPLKWAQYTPTFRPMSGLGHTVLHGDPAPPSKKGAQPNRHFSAHVCCGQALVWGIFHQFL